MQELMKRLALIGLIATLAGCNSTDALTPQAEVGGGFNSPPVTQNDLDQMSAQTMPVATTSQQTAFTTPAETGVTSGRDTAGTLEGQADALARNPGGGRAASDTTLAREAPPVGPLGPPTTAPIAPALPAPAGATTQVGHAPS